MQNKTKLQDKLINESGVTLIELLAALVILSIIVLSFIGFFIQSSRTTDQSGDINEATFIAQEEMEEIVYYSSTESHENALVALIASDRSHETVGNEERFTKRVSNYTVQTVLTEGPQENLYTVIIKVFEDDKLRAQMENRLPFDGE